MKISTTLFLACLLSGLGVYYFFIENPSRDRSAELTPSRILNLAEDDAVTWLQIQSEATGETIALKLEGSGWALDYPVSYPAENFLVKGMVSTLTFAQRLRRFPLKGKNVPNDLGLEKPKLKIAVVTKKDPHKHQLLIGGDSPVGGAVYARWKGEEEYFLVSSEVKAAFERTAYSLRKKKLFRLNWDDVTWMEAKAEKRQYRIEKRAEKWYQVLSTGVGEIPLEKVSDLIYSFQSLYIKEFLDGKDPADNKFGLKANQAFLSAGGAGSGGEKLILGARAEGQGALYALREPESLVFLVSEPKVNSLLQMFRSIFEEPIGASQGKASRDPGKDEGGVSQSREKSGRGEARSRDQGGTGRENRGSV